MTQYPPTYNPHVLEANGHRNKVFSSTFVLYLNAVNTVTQLLLGFVVCSAVSFANFFSVSSSFTQHIYLCVIGYVVLMSQAILSFNNHSGWAASIEYPTKRKIHGVMQIAGSIFAIAGSVIRIIDRDQHFQSPHAVTGIIALVLTFVSLIGGVFNLFFPGQDDAILSKTLHVIVGGMTLTVAFICLCLGFNNNWYKFTMGITEGNLSITFTLFALVGILISGSCKSIERFKGRL